MLLMSGCPALEPQHQPSPPPPAEEEVVAVEEEVASANGGGSPAEATEKPSIQLLVRDFLQDREDEDFGYFVYLIFAEQSESTRQKRLAAAKAFICQHSTVSEALELEVNKSELAVFYAPVKKKTNLLLLSQSQSPGTLLKEYNYAWANLLRRQLTDRDSSEGKRFDFSVGIIGSPKPLMARGTEINLDKVVVLNMDKDSSYQIAKRVREFRKGLLSLSTQTPGAEAGSTPSLATRVRNFLYSVGSLVIPETAIAGDPDVVCL